jgi:AraC-like DNA-binding protein
LTHADTPKSEKAARTQERAILALLAHSRLEDAAREAGVSRSTLCRMLQEEAFRESFRAARTQVFEAAVSALQGATGAAVETLIRLLKCRRPMVALHAARAVLEHARQGELFLELEERVRAIEANQAQRTGGRR